MTGKKELCFSSLFHFHLTPNQPGARVGAKGRECSLDIWGACSVRADYGAVLTLGKSHLLHVLSLRFRVSGMPGLQVTRIWGDKQPTEWENLKIVEPGETAAFHPRK